MLPLFSGWALFLAFAVHLAALAGPEADLAVVCCVVGLSSVFGWLHPRSRSGFFGITFFTGTLFDKNAGIRISSAWASDPQLGLVARCGARAQIHFRGLCHWAGELTARQAAEPPSRRAAECASARKSSPPRPHRPQGQFETHPAKWHVHTPPCSAFHLLSSPTLHTLGHLQWRQPPSFVGSSGAAWLGSERHRHPRDPTTRPLRRSPRNP